jgi:hypothetical protein
MPDWIVWFMVGALFVTFLGFICAVAREPQYVFVPFTEIELR